MNEVDRLQYLIDEISILKTRADARERGAGNLYTTINVLEERLVEVRENLYEATAAFKPNSYRKENI